MRLQNARIRIATVAAADRRQTSADLIDRVIRGQRMLSRVTLSSATNFEQT